MNKSETNSPEGSTWNVMQPRRLHFLRLVTWYVYAFRLLRLEWSRFALIFFAWFIMTETLTVLPYIGFWVKIAFAIITAQGLAWCFHSAASGRRPMPHMVLRGFTLPVPIQVFLVAQILVAFAIGVAYAGWSEGPAVVRFLALRDFVNGTRPQPETMRVLKIIVDVGTVWFGFVGLLGLFGIEDLRTVITASVRATVLNFPALLIMSLLEMLVDVVQENVPQTVTFVLAGLVFTVFVIALSVGASYASFRDIFRPPNVRDEAEDGESR